MGKFKLGGRECCGIFQLQQNGSLSSFDLLQAYDDDAVQIGWIQLD
jgi:hypothetical protein